MRDSLVIKGPDTYARMPKGSKNIDHHHPEPQEKVILVQRETIFGSDVRDPMIEYGHAGTT